MEDSICKSSVRDKKTEVEKSLKGCDCAAKSFTFNDCMVKSDSCVFEQTN